MKIFQMFKDNGYFLGDQEGIAKAFYIKNKNVVSDSIFVDRVFFISESIK